MTAQAQPVPRPPWWPVVSGACACREHAACPGHCAGVACTCGCHEHDEE